MLKPCSFRDHGDRISFRPAQEPGYSCQPQGVFVRRREWDLWAAVVGSGDPLVLTGEVFVYGAVCGDLIKIGSSYYPLHRGSWFGEIVFIEKGGLDRERELQREFVSLRKVLPSGTEGGTEWFRYEGALRAYVDG